MIDFDSSRNHRGTRTLLLVLFILSSPLAGCKRWTERGAKGIGVLPGAPATGAAYSRAESPNPYHQYAPGLLARTLYRAPSPGGTGYRVEVWDLMVGPRHSADSVSLPGGAVFEVRYGGGVLNIGGKAREIALGTTFSISEGSAFRLDNRSDAPLVMRVHLFTTHQPKP